MYKNLRPLPIGKTVRFSSPIHKNLVRTGTISEGSCFFHSVLTASSATYRATMNHSDKMKYVSKLRKALSNNLTESKWKRLGSSEVSIQIFIREYFEFVYQHISNPKNNISSSVQRIIDNIELNKHSKLYRLISTILSFEKLDNIVLSHAFDKCSSYVRKDPKISFENRVKIIKKVVNNAFSLELKKHDNKNELGEKRQEYFCKKFDVLLSEIIKNSIFSAYRKFRDELKDSNTWIQQDSIEYLSDFFKRDIYFVDSRTRLPYKQGPCNYKRRDSIVILWLGDSHFENIGHIINTDTNEVRRTFSYEDPIISRITELLFNGKPKETEEECDKEEDRQESESEEESEREDNKEDSEQDNSEQDNSEQDSDKDSEDEDDKDSEDEDDKDSEDEDSEEDNSESESESESEEDSDKDSEEDDSEQE